MKTIVVFIAIIGYSYGILYWDHLHGGDVENELPNTEDKAKAAQWKAQESDSDLKVQWYGKDGDPSLLLGFDQKKGLAGVRVTFLEDNINKDYINVYKKSGIFEEKTISEKKYYTSTVLFTQTNVLKSGGRRTTDEDEIAMGLYLKKNGEYVQLFRSACKSAKEKDYIEQGCQPKYGLVFSLFKKEDQCDSLAPFYLVFNEEDKVGELLGFGWLSFSKENKASSYDKVLSAEQLKTLLPSSPACLSSSAEKGLSAVEIWLAKKESKESKCEEAIGKFVENRCQEKRSKRPKQEEGEDF